MKRPCETSEESSIAIDLTSREDEFAHFNFNILEQTHNPEISVSERRTFGKIFRSNYRESVVKFHQSGQIGLLSDGEIDDLCTTCGEDQLKDYEDWVSPHKGEIHLHSDCLLHFPYDRFQDLLDAIARHANEMRGILLSVYRLADDSEIVRLLGYLIKIGIEVTIMIEINAKGNEASNIRYAHQLKLLGANVVISDTVKKNHAKFIIIEWENHPDTGLIMTGNLNEVTANIYEDYCLITNDQEIVVPLKERVIQLITSMNYPITHSDRIFFTQDNAAITLVRNIQEQSHPGGRIVIKCNLFTDVLMMGLLEHAADQGCQIELICRGECCWKPRNPNVHVHRFIHKYLEHSRVYVFGDRVYIGSLDLATHKLFGRFELICQIVNPAMTQEIIGVLDRMIGDKTNRHYRLDSHDHCHRYLIYRDFMKGDFHERI